MKLDRAKQRMKELEEALQSFYATNPFKFSGKADLQAGKVQPCDPKSYGCSSTRWIASAGSKSRHCQDSIEGPDTGSVSTLVVSEVVALMENMRRFCFG